MNKIILRQLIKEGIRSVLIEKNTGFESWSIEDFIENESPSVNEDRDDFKDIKDRPANYDQMSQNILDPKKRAAQKNKPIAARDAGLIHASTIRDKDGNPVDEEVLKNIIKQRPTQILGANQKLQKSAKSAKQFAFYDTTLPAFQGLYVDESTDELRIIRTCPAAGECAKYCYAAKGGYIMFEPSMIASSRLVNFLINDTDGFENQLISEIKSAEARHKKKDVITVIRWHDSGDFFSKKYLDMAYDVARATPETIHYAYTKALKMVRGSDKPKNFIFNFSVGGIHDKLIDRSSEKFAEVVPKELFSDLIYNKKKHTDDEYVEVGSKKLIKGWLEVIKQRMADYYKIPLESIITYKEMINIPYDPKSDIKPKYNVIVVPGEGDNSAMRKDVLGTYLLIH